MRLGDLLGCTVRDATGSPLGQVSDVRLVQDGPIVGTQASMRVDALVVGRGGLAERLGFVRNTVGGPWLLTAIFIPLERRARVVQARDVAEWDHEARLLTLAPGAVVHRHGVPDDV